MMKFSNLSLWTLLVSLVYSVNAQVDLDSFTAYFDGANNLNGIGVKFKLFYSKDTTIILNLDKTDRSQYYNEGTIPLRKMNMRLSFKAISLVGDTIEILGDDLLINAISSYKKIKIKCKKNNYILLNGSIPLRMSLYEKKLGKHMVVKNVIVTVTDQNNLDKMYYFNLHLRE